VIVLYVFELKYRVGALGAVVSAGIGSELVFPFVAFTAVSVNGPYDVFPARPVRVYDVAPELIPVIVVNPEPDRLYDAWPPLVGAVILNTIWVFVFDETDRVGGFGRVVVAASVAGAPVPLVFTGTILNVPAVGYNVFPSRPVIV
jgi:hypothetical protein